MAGDAQNQAPGMRTVVVRGEATVAAANKIKSELADALKEGSAVHVVLDAITNADVTLLQLLCSAHRTAAEQNKVLTMEGGDRSPVAQLIQHAGFLRHIGCHEITGQPCLWIDTQPGKGSRGI